MYYPEVPLLKAVGDEEDGQISVEEDVIHQNGDQGTAPEESEEPDNDGGDTPKASRVSVSLSAISTFCFVGRSRISPVYLRECESFRVSQRSVNLTTYYVHWTEWGMIFKSRTYLDEGVTNA